MILECEYTEDGRRLGGARYGDIGPNWITCEDNPRPRAAARPKAPKPAPFKMRGLTPSKFPWKPVYAHILNADLGAPPAPIVYISTYVGSTQEELDADRITRATHTGPFVALSAPRSPGPFVALSYRGPFVALSIPTHSGRPDANQTAHPMERREETG